MLIKTNYNEIRTSIKNGDIIAFGGKGIISDLIKLFTRSCVTHVAVVLREGTNEKTQLNQIIESTSLEYYSGVIINKLSNRIKEYDGNVWVLPIKNTIYNSCNWEHFYKFLLVQRNKPYDTMQAIGSVFDLFWNNRDELSKIFCSELIIESFKQVNIINSDIVSSEVTPIDLCMATLFEKDYYQVKGDTTEIKGYNSVELGDWVI